MQSLKIIIGGGTGFIGGNIREYLRSKGHSVSVISRRALKEGSREGGDHPLTWDQLKKEPLPHCDVVMQFTGANLMEKRWTESRKRELSESRAGLTKILVDAVNRSEKPPSLFLCGSAVGIYPTETEEEFNDFWEGEPPATFPAQLVKEWEESVNGLQNDKIRKVWLRNGIVLGRNVDTGKVEGALNKMYPQFYVGLGGPYGSGLQHWPWIHVKDIVRLVEHIIKVDRIKGPVNSVTEYTPRNGEFAMSLGRVMNRPSTYFWVPETILKTMLGERAQMLLEGQKVVPRKAASTGFKWQFSALENAMNEVLYLSDPKKKQ